MNRIRWAMTAAMLCATPLLAGSPPADEKAVWSLEDRYWRYVQTDDMEGYRTLWHRDFLGWPLSSPEPVRKQHITDWITAHTSKGESLKSFELEHLAAQSTGNNVTVTYRVRMRWADKGGAERPSSLRVIHTWLRGTDGQWQIISGMAAPPDAQGH